MDHRWFPAASHYYLEQHGTSYTQEKQCSGYKGTQNADALGITGDNEDVHRDSPR